MEKIGENAFNGFRMICEGGRAPGQPALAGSLGPLSFWAFAVHLQRPVIFPLTTLVQAWGIVSRVKVEIFE